MLRVRRRRRWYGHFRQLASRFQLGLISAADDESVIHHTHLLFTIHTTTRYRRQAYTCSQASFAVTAKLRPWLHVKLKKKHFYNILRPRHSRGKSTALKHFCKCFILRSIGQGSRVPDNCAVAQKLCNVHRSTLLFHSRCVLYMCAC